MFKVFEWANMALASPLFTAAASVAHERLYVVHEASTLLHDFAETEPLDPAVTIPVRIGLRQQNLDEGLELLMESSRHDSFNHGGLWTADEVIDKFAPSHESVEAVMNWVRSNGVPGHRITQSTNKQWIQFDASVREANRLLRTEHLLYGTDDRILAASGYSVPADTQHHIDYITPGIRGLKVQRAHYTKRQSRHLKPHDLKKQISLVLGDIPDPQDLFNCTSMVTPACIFSLYNLTRNDLDTPAALDNELGIFESLGEVYVQAALDNFTKTFVPEREIPTGFAPKVVLIDGASFVTDPATYQNDHETMFDYEVAIPIVYPQQTVLYISDDDYYQHFNRSPGLFNTLLDAIDGSYCSHLEPEDPTYPDPSNSSGAYKGSLQCGVFKATNVINLSFVLQEDYSLAQAAAQLSSRYLARQCQEYMKLGLQGTTVVVASGDYGVANGECLGPKNDIFIPTFPSSCPYVLSVGATTLRPGSSENRFDEVAATFDGAGGGSGGGFSNLFDVPQYQKNAVQNYLDYHVPEYPYYLSQQNNSFGANGGIYNRNGRGFPDVSAVGQSIVFLNETGSLDTEDGTSGSAPIWAAMLTKINDMRMNSGKTPVGFINPILYGHPEIFNDVVTGQNGGRAYGCGVNGSTGFTASPGWDPVTGLGTPRFQILKKVLLSLP